MKTLRIVQGDLSFDGGGYQMIEGVSKVEQDLTLATLEPVGTDRFHPSWGSSLQRMIGSRPTQHAIMLIQSEIARIIRNYALIQSAAIEADSLNDARSRLTLGETVAEINGIDVKQELDRLIFRVSVSTMSGEEIVMVREVGI
jgi:phage baseplate assembly protein W